MLKLGNFLTVTILHTIDSSQSDPLDALGVTNFLKPDGAGWIPPLITEECCPTNIAEGPVCSSFATFLEIMSEKTVTFVVFWSLICLFLATPVEVLSEDTIVTFPDLFEMFVLKNPKSFCF